MPFLAVSYDDHFQSSTKTPLSRTFTLTTDQSVTEAMTVVRDIFSERNAKIQATSPTHLHATEGSRFALRMWGVMTKRGYNNLPLVASIDTSRAADGRGSVVSVTLTSNEGWYPLGRAEIGNRAYKQRFDAIEVRMKSLLGTGV